MMEEPQPNDLRQTLSRGIQGTLSYLKALGTKAIGWWQTLEPQHGKLLLGLGVSIVLIGVILAIWMIPLWQRAPLKAKIQRERGDQTITALERLKLEYDARKLENDARTTLVQAFGGLALLIGLYFTAKTWRTTQEGQVTDRFTKAINQLGEAGPEKLAIRLGGIYALERIARDSERDHWPIMEILTAYVREHAPWPAKAIPLLAHDLSPTEKSPEGNNQPQPKPAPDIQALLTVLGRRARTFGKGEDQRLDLGRTALRGANLGGAHLEEAFLAGARLEGADLGGAHLERANLTEAHLEGAFLGGAHLEEAFLAGARLEGADLGGAHLERANLTEAHLEGANLEEARLEGANLEEAHLEGAIYLTVTQLSTVKTLYHAQLDPPLFEQIEQLYPHLLKEPQD